MVGRIRKLYLVVTDHKDNEFDASVAEYQLPFMQLNSFEVWTLPDLVKTSHFNGVEAKWMVDWKRILFHMCGVFV